MPCSYLEATGMVSALWKWCLRNVHSSKSMKTDTLSSCDSWHIKGISMKVGNPEVSVGKRCSYMYVFAFISWLLMPLWEPRVFLERCLFPTFWPPQSLTPWRQGSRPGRQAPCGDPSPPTRGLGDQ